MDVWFIEPSRVKNSINAILYWPFVNKQINKVANVSLAYFKRWELTFQK